MNRAERRAASRENQRWLRALWASDAPAEAKQLGSELVAIATPEGRVTLPSEGSVTFVLRVPQQRAAVASR